MTNTVQDRVKTDWEKAQKEGSQRAERIRKIVQAAATEAFGEIKQGSSEFGTLGRQSLAEMIEQLKAKEAEEAAAEASAVNHEAAGDEAAAAPTWAEIFADLRHLANDRKVDWAQNLLTSLQNQIDRFDTDMSTEYGDRYGLFRPLVRGVRSLVALAHGKIGHPAESDAPIPVQIEVLDDSETPVTSVSETAVDDSANA